MKTGIKENKMAEVKEGEKLKYLTTAGIMAALITLMTAYICHVPVGTNLIPNGNFSEGLKDWWVSRKPEEVEVTVQNGEVYVSAKCNFTFELSCSVFIDKPGKYRLSAEYRGTNTTGVQVELFLKTISCNEQNEIIKTIFPSDVCFTTYCIDDVMLEIGQVQLGIRMNTPPIFGRIRNISLVETEKD